MQQGGSPYGAPPTSHQQQAELTPFHHVQMAPEAAPPISTRPPPPGGGGAAPVGPNYEEFGPAGDDVLGPAGDEAGSGGVPGNRWPRQETLALLKIRSDMDTAFRDATLKGPLWEEVSRKLADLGYNRNAKKCKEKFENVHKYYKRTKEGRAGRQDGKSYRFFDQLEALHNITSPVGSVISSPSLLMANPAPATTALANATSAQNPWIQPMQISVPAPIAAAPPPSAPPSLQAVMAAHEHPSTSAVAAAAGAAVGISFSSNTSSSLGGTESDDDDDEATQEGLSSRRKRKREATRRRGSEKMMPFFEGLMRQVMERQESMQQRFLEAIEKGEQDRMIREEAWRRQEMSRAAREQELAAQERSAAAARDATIISLLQKLTGQPVQLPPPAIQTPPPPVPQVQVQPPPPEQQQSATAIQNPPPSIPPPTNLVQQPQQQPPAPPPTSTELVPARHEGVMVISGGASFSSDPASSRWPKPEVHALIKLRSSLDSRYQETGPKGPLWEEISAGMQRLGYNRSSKRCKEKWENINKYFKKVKESNKRRPEDAKTCPYFHQLDALYRSKHLSGSTIGAHNVSPNPNPAPISMIAPPPSQTTHQQQHGLVEKKNGGNTDPRGGAAPSNGGNASGSGVMMKKPEDIVKELMGQSDDYRKPDHGDSDNMEDYDEDDDDDEDDEDGNGQFRIQFQRQNVGPNSGGGGGGGGGTPTTNAGGGKPASGSSFLAMVR